VDAYAPGELYYLAAVHSPSDGNLSLATDLASFDIAFRTHARDYLEFITAVDRYCPTTPVFYAASALVYEGSRQATVNRDSPMTPLSFYAMSKAQGVWLGRKFREEKSLQIYSGILFNHESVLRAPSFFSAKLIRGALSVQSGESRSLELNNFDARVDWGYAPEYIEGFQAVVRSGKPDEYLFATGEQHSAATFAELVFAELGLDWTRWVRETRNRTDRHPLPSADTSTIEAETGWRPSVDFHQMVRQLVRDHLSSTEADTDS
jgi:GDPmannose 4,6-dehydratase